MYIKELEKIMKESLWKIWDSELNPELFWKTEAVSNFDLDIWKPFTKKELNEALNELKWVDFIDKFSKCFEEWKFNEILTFENDMMKKWQIMITYNPK